MQIELKPQIVQKEVDCEACITGNGSHSCNQTVKIERSVSYENNVFTLNAKVDGEELKPEILTEAEFNKLTRRIGVQEATR